MTTKNGQNNVACRRIPTIKSLKATTTKITLALLLGSSMTPLVVQAGASAETQKALFATADWNKDGKVTEREFVLTALYSLFNGCKKAENGKLTKAEYMAAIAGCPEAKNEEAEWAVMDVEGRGYITFKDVLRNKRAIEEMKAKFKQLDKGGKGFIAMADLPRVNG
ncbi:MAG TPA: hypothetical protein VIT91_20580 [Chthoniobacterales bacterium]